MTGLDIALILAVVAAICLAAYWVLFVLSKRRRQQADEQLEQVKQSLDQVIRRLPQIGRAARQYPQAQEPYGPVARELEQQCTQIHAVWQDCDAQRRQLAAQRRPASANLLQQAWTSWSSEFSHCRRQLQEIASLAESVRTLTDSIGQAQASLEQLRTMPLEAARRACDLHVQSAGMAPLVQALQQAGVHGPTFEAAADQAAELQRSLAQLPGWCTLADDNHVLAQATQASTIQVWRMLDELE
ncbi:MAG: hypothetical protein R6X16_06090, partial [Anaerolineae bacterium]